MTITDKELRLSRVSMKHSPKHKYPVEKRIECVTKCLALGNIKLVAELTGVSYGLLRVWRTMPWWKDMEAEILAARRAETDTKLSKIVDRSLAIVADRLDNGDWAYDKKTGTAYRKEINVLAATKVASEMLQRQDMLKKQEQVETSAQQTQTVADQIAHLASEFAKFNTKRTITSDVTDVQEKTFALHDEREARLQERESAVFEQAGADQESGGAECGPGSDDESWEGQEGGWERCGPYDSSEQGGDQFYEESPHSITERQSLFQPE